MWIADSPGPTLTSILWLVPSGYWLVTGDEQCLCVLTDCLLKHQSHTDKTHWLAAGECSEHHSLWGTLWCYWFQTRLLTSSWRWFICGKQSEFTLCGLWGTSSDGVRGVGGHALTLPWPSLNLCGLDTAWWWNRVGCDNKGWKDWKLIKYKKVRDVTIVSSDSRILINSDGQ